MAPQIDKSVQPADKQRRLLLGIAAVMFTPLQAMAQGTWKLITPEEEARDDAAPEAPTPTELPPPPTIDLIRPDISQPIRNPVTIDVRFSPTPGQSVDMRTFNATYGRLGINITRRLLEHATSTANGLTAAGVELPRGRHRVTVSVADTSGKTASRTFQFTVAS